MREPEPSFRYLKIYPLHWLQNIMKDRLGILKVKVEMEAFLGIGRGVQIEIQIK